MADLCTLCLGTLDSRSTFRCAICGQIQGAGSPRAVANFYESHSVGHAGAYFSLDGMNFAFEVVAVLKGTPLCEAHLLQEMSRRA